MHNEWQPNWECCQKSKKGKLCKKKMVHCAKRKEAQLWLIMCTLTLGLCLPDEMKGLSPGRGQYDEDDDDKLCIIKNFTFRYLTCRVQRIRYKTRRIAFSFVFLPFLLFGKTSRARARVECGLSGGRAGVEQE